MLLHNSMNGNFEPSSTLNVKFDIVTPFCIYTFDSGIIVNSSILTVFNVEFDGTAHDPMYDATNLAKLYDEFMKNKEIVSREYLKNLNKTNFHPEPVNKAIKKLLNGESVTPEEFKSYIDEYID